MAHTFMYSTSFLFALSLFWSFKYSLATDLAMGNLFIN